VTFALPHPRSLSRSTIVGLAALTMTVALWSAFALSTRALGHSGLTVADASILRFGVPAVALIPWMPRTLRALRAERSTVVALVLLAGLPHFLLFAWGAQLTSAALTGLLVPGTVPLFVTVLSWMRYRRRLSRRRWVALGAITTGVAASALCTGGDASVGGVAVLVVAGFVWALYTLGLSATRLDPLGVMVVVSVTSLGATVVLASTGVMPSHLLDGTADAHDIVTYAVLQGIGTGLLSTTCYVLAVKHLGGVAAATAGALSPVVTAVIAVPLLGEPITAGLAISLALIVSGVVVSSSEPARRESATDPAGPPRHREVDDVTRAATTLHGSSPQGAPSPLG